MKELTVSQITAEAIKTLESRFCFVWRQNNLAVKGRTFNGLKGVPDIIGYNKFTGISVYCEVKTINDKMSQYQIDFMNKAKTSGCHCLIATESDGAVILKEWPNN
jgi:hypothetical protein